ncbi:MAG: hypothetical protein ACK5NT_03955 [Pyrinomonadaceae bacterium]
MSTRAFHVVVLIISIFGAAYGEDAQTSVNIEVIPNQNAAKISIIFANPVDNKLEFIESYAGFSGLRNRVSEMRCWDTANVESACEAASVAKMEYKISLVPNSDLMASAHISWLYKEKSLLMLNDLLPGAMFKQFRTRVGFELPQGWQVEAAEPKQGGLYLVEDIANAVFLAYKTGEVRVLEGDGGNGVIALDGEWRFKDQTAKEFSGEIIAYYSKLFRTPPKKNPSIFVLNFPGEIVRNRWRAETRGSNVTIISSGATFPSQDEQRLHEQLRHELFHLWIPGRLGLAGDYAWFYEGFGSYMALKTGVALERIRFVDFLNVLSQAYSMEQRRINTPALAESSASSLIYVRGILAGFATDVEITNASDGKRDIANLFRNLLEKFGDGKTSAEAKPALLDIFGEFPELSFIVERNIKTGNRFDLKRELGLAGIEFVNGEFTTRKKLSKRQKEILGDLGYNKRRS